MSVYPFKSSILKSFCYHFKPQKPTRILKIPSDGLHAFTIKFIVPSHSIITRPFCTTWFIALKMLSLWIFPLPNPLKGYIMAEENKIKVNDLPEDKKEQTEETELPVINNEEKTRRSWRRRLLRRMRRLIFPTKPPRPSEKSYFSDAFSFLNTYR